MSLTEITFSAIGKALTYILGIVFTLIQQLTVWLITAFNYLVYIRVDNGMPVINQTWTILRDFSNMLFILALVWMAFATIFNLKGFTFRDMILRFVIVAILINFSLAIGGIVVDASQVLSNVFLNMIGDPAARIGQYLNPSAFVQIKESTLAGNLDVTAGAGLTLLFTIILSGMFMFSILVADIFAFIRIFMIWGLLIISPLAWMANILPGTKGKFKEWWGLFLGWNLFLPLYLFFLYLGLLFLSQRDAIMSAVLKNTSGGDVAIDTISNSFSINLLFFYIFAAVIIGYGPVYARNLTSKFSFGSQNFLKYGYGYARSIAGKVTGYDIRKQALQEARTARLNQFQQRGFENRYLNKIYGGKEGDERLKAKYNRLLPGQREVREGALSKGVELEKTRQKPFANNIVELQRLANSGSPEQKIAARLRLSELGMLDGHRVNETYQMLGGDRSEAANKFVGGINYGKLSEDDRKLLFGAIDNIEVRKKIAEARLEKDKMSEEDIQKIVDEIGQKDANNEIINKEDIKEILDKGLKKNMVNVLKIKISARIEEAGKKLDETMIDALKKMSDDQILETMNSLDLKDKETMDAFDAAIQDEKVLGKNPKRLVALATKTSGELADRLNKYAEKARERAPKYAQLVAKLGKANDKLNDANLQKTNLENAIATKEAEMAHPGYPFNYQAAATELAQLKSQRSALQKEIETLEEKRDEHQGKIDNYNAGTE